MNVQQISRENAEGTEFLETFGAIVNLLIFLEKRLVFDQLSNSKATLEKSFHVLTLATT